MNKCGSDDENDVSKKQGETLPLGFLVLTREPRVAGIPSSAKNYLENLSLDFLPQDRSSSGFSFQSLKTKIFRKFLIPSLVKRVLNRQSKNGPSASLSDGRFSDASLSQKTMVQVIDSELRVLHSEAVGQGIETERIAPLIDTASLSDESSIEHALEAFRVQGVGEILILPLIPEWTPSGRGQLEAIIKHWRKKKSDGVHAFVLPRVSVFQTFFNGAAFIRSQVRLLRKTIDDFVETPHFDENDLTVVFDFSGASEAVLKEHSPSCGGCIKRKRECTTNQVSGDQCYRYQCFEVARKMGTAAGLSHWRVSFNRPFPWVDSLVPHLPMIRDQLIEEGVQKLVVVRPFVLFSMGTDFWGQDWGQGQNWEQSPHFETKSLDVKPSRFLPPNRSSSNDPLSKTHPSSEHSSINTNPAEPLRQRLVPPLLESEEAESFLRELVRLAHSQYFPMGKEPLESPVDEPRGSIFEGRRESFFSEPPPR